MQYEKVFDGTVDVDSPINFCADKGRHLLAELRNKYAGRCYKGAFVLDVVSVLDAGACHVMRTNGSGRAFVDVRFLARVAVFSRWDILTGVEVVSHQQMLVGAYERALEHGAARAVVTVLASKAAEALAVGQRVAVRVVLAAHAPLQLQASVVGTLLVCDAAAPAFRLRGALDGAAAGAELAPMLAAVERELAARAALVAARRADLWFFEALLYAFRGAPAGADAAVAAWEGGPVWEGPAPLRAAEAPVVSVLDVARRAVAGEVVPCAGVWSRPLALYRSSPLAACAGAGTPAPPSWGPVVDGTPRAVFAEFLKNILDFLVATRELVAVYHSRELIDKHLGLWGSMRAAQTPA